MSIDRLPSGKYRIRKMIKGKSHSVIVDHKPTKSESERLMREYLNQNAEPDINDSFRDCAISYIKSKDNILSPTTVREYYGMLDRISDEFREKPICEINQRVIQTEINSFAARLAPKTVKNYHDFISTVLKTYRPDMHLRTSIPPKEKKYPIIPTDDEIKAVLEAVKGTEYWVPFMLGCCALRRSEICALELSDLDGNLLHIHRAKVRSRESGMIIKDYPKTTDSNRKIYIPSELADRIREQGHIFDYHPNQLLKRLRREQKHLGQRKYDFHALRKYYASMAHAMGIPDKYIMQYGGWSSDHVMKDVYVKAMEDKDKAMQEKALEHLQELI